LQTVVVVFGIVVVVVLIVVVVLTVVVVVPGYALVPAGAEDAYASHALQRRPRATSMLTSVALALRRIRVPITALLKEAPPFKQRRS